MTQDQLIRCIEQQLENIAHFDDSMANQLENDLYYGNEEPIVELFTLELLNQLENLVDLLDND